MSGRTLLVLSGGTGGHVFPALAIADGISKCGWKVIWVGSLNGIEAKLVPAAGYPVTWIRFTGLRGKNLIYLLMLPWRLVMALGICINLIFRERPDVILGMGGYISFPGALAALLLRRPLVLHEQNAIAGMVNRICSLWADKILLGYPGALKGRNARVEITGNPVRGEILALKPPENRYGSRSGPLKVLVIGGSLGARVLNEVIPKAVALLKENERPEILHQTGKKDCDEVKQAYAESGVKAEVNPFIGNMADAYAKADLVICRAGALTVAELAGAGVASVLVPYPHAVDDHQTVNAHYLVDAGGALLFVQDQLTPQRLANLISSMKREDLMKMAVRAKGLAMPDAVSHVITVCKRLAEEANA